jgi:hypothetical protein
MCYVLVCRSLKPPPHGKTATYKEVHLSTTYSLNENSTAPRRSVERSNIRYPYLPIVFAKGLLAKMYRELFWKVNYLVKKVLKGLYCNGVKFARRM